jgi:hypothetical protein
MGNILMVSDTLVWDAADVPNTEGAYSLIALIDTNVENLIFPINGGFDSFIRFIRNNNKVAQRTFDVVNHAPPIMLRPVEDSREAVHEYIPLDFLATGAPDKARLMQLGVVTCLPEGARVLIEMPLNVLDGLYDRSPYVIVDNERKVVQVPTHPNGRLLFKEVLFPANSQVPLKLLVHIPQPYRQYAFELSVQQLYQGEEVGRITWRLGPHA